MVTQCVAHAQIFEGVAATHKGFFEAGPDGAPPAVPELIPSASSFKILAETPLQVREP